MTTTPNNQDDELEMQLMELFTACELFGQTFMTSATKEEFADAIRYGALDHQEAAHKAMQLIFAWHNQQCKIKEDRAYKQGWDSAGGELVVTKDELEQAVIEARIDQAKRTRGTMYVNAPNTGHEKVGKEIELLEAQLSKSQESA